MIFECPGSQRFKEPTPEYIKCKSCGEEVEVWTDEVQATCPKCRASVTRQESSNCLDWCKYAKECVGEQKYSNYLKNKSVIMKDRLIKELEEYFGKDKRRIDHAKNVMGFAEELLRHEKADWHIVIPASILHDVGIKVAEQKHGSSAGHYQEREGPAIARDILVKVGVKEDDINEICEIIAHHHSPGKINTQNFKVLYDADWLVNLNGEVDIKDKNKLKEVINKVFLTKTGEEMARKTYL